MKFIRIIAITFLMVCIATQARAQEQQVLDNINYTFTVADTTGQTAGITFRIPMAQFDTPTLFILSILDSSDTKVFESVTESDLLKASRVDTSGVFSMDDQDFILTIQNLSPQTYTARFQVIQEDGTVYYMVREENWWSEEGGQP